jgi:hypothetical protein
VSTVSRGETVVKVGGVTGVRHLGNKGQAGGGSGGGQQQMPSTPDALAAKLQDATVSVVTAYLVARHVHSSILRLSVAAAQQSEAAVGVVVLSPQAAAAPQQQAWLLLVMLLVLGVHAVADECACMPLSLAALV